MAVLETSVATGTRENMKKAPKSKKVILVAQELKLARVLAGNNKTARDRALKGLKKWFQNRSTALPFNEDDFMRLWKGLFYSMWMSDKSLIQEECAENISKLVHALPADSALLFFKCGLKTLVNEWFGIDQLRLDKFLMFVRRLLRQALFVIKEQKWAQGYINDFSDILLVTVLSNEATKPVGLLMHFVEIYLEEVAKVSEANIPPSHLTPLIQPFIRHLASTDDSRIIDHIKKHIFLYLIKQSDLGLEYDEKYKAWRSLGFPGSIDSMQKVEVDDSERDEEEQVDENKAYDPRAGRVNVDLPQLRFSANAIVKALSGFKFDKNSNSKSRRCISGLIEHFKKLASGIYPLGIKKLKLPNDVYDTSIRKAVNRLVKFDQKIKGKRNKKRKAEIADNVDEDKMELRGGKRIKLNDRLQKLVEEEFTDILVNPEKNMKLKRKMLELDDNGIPTKQQKNAPPGEFESAFERNSGMWLVTKIADVEPEERSSPDQGSKVIYQKNKWVERANQSPPSPISKQRRNKVLFPSSRWEKISKEVEMVESQLKRDRLSLPTQLIKNPFATPKSMKKVKINVKLNKSQDVQEHREQIRSSPAIPYDANRKPSKPLLKTSNLKSPINPFYAL